MTTAARRALFRVDAGPGIGNGHAMRCLALAQHLIDKGWNCELVTAAGSPLYDRWRNEGIVVSKIAADPGTEVDASETIRRAAVVRPDWLVLDGYHFRTAYQRRICDAGSKLLYVDDVANSEIEAEVVLNQNPGAEERFATAYPMVRRKLLGASYVLLRRELRLARRIRKPRHIAVTFGGSALDGLAQDAIVELKQLCGRGITATIVESCPTRQYVESRAQTTKQEDGVLQIPPTELSSLLAEASVLVCGGGVTALEAAFMGVPAVIVTLAENQRPGVTSLVRAGAALHAGEGRGAVRVAVQLAVELALDEERSNVMSTRGQVLIDGYGAERIEQAMLDRSGHC